MCCGILYRKYKEIKIQVLKGNKNKEINKEIKIQVLKVQVIITSHVACESVFNVQVTQSQTITAYCITMHQFWTNAFEIYTVQAATKVTNVRRWGTKGGGFNVVDNIFLRCRHLNVNV